MERSIFFIWLNDTTPNRHYWMQNAQNWTTDFAKASKFDTRAIAHIEAEFAERSTKAEVVVQEMLVPA